MLKAFLSSAGARVLTLPVTALASALTTYLLVGAYGAETFGYINLLATFFLLLPFADLGLGAAIISAVATRDRTGGEEVKALIRAAFRALLISAAALLALLALLAANGTITRLLAIPSGISEFANLAVFIAIAPFAISLPFGIGQRILQGLGLNATATLLAAVTPLTAVLATAIMVALKTDPLFLAAATPIGIFLSAIASFFIAMHRGGWGRSGQEIWRSRAKADLNQLWSAAVPMLIIAVAVPVGIQSGRIVLSNFGTAQELAEYAVAFQFYVPAFSVASTAAVALWPIFARGETRNRVTWKKGLLLMSLVGGILAAGFAIIIRPVGSLLSSGEIQVGWQLAWGLGALLLVNSIHQASAMFLTTPKLLTFQAISAVLMASLSLAAAIWFVGPFGAAGVSLAILLGVLLGQTLPGIAVALRVTKG